jgi:hypothetical protein
MAGVDPSQLDSLTAEQVEELHKNADTDVRRESMHHTLGPRGTQAAAGDHNHDGSNSSLLLTGVTITGSRASSASITPSLIAALVKLGATDSSTA